MEDLEEVLLDLQHLKRVIHVRVRLFEGPHKNFIDFIIEYKDIFAWLHMDMLDIDPSIIVHRFKVDTHAKPVA